MTRKFLVTLLSVTMGLGLMLPAQAEESDQSSDQAASNSTTSAKPAKATKSSKATKASKQQSKAEKEPKADQDAKADKEAKPEKSAKAGSKVGLPERLASFAVGTFVGIPVAFVRKTKEETIIATRDLVGDTSNPLLWGPASILGVPAGLISGAFDGVIYGTWNAWKHSGEEPFGKDAFSLGDME